ncbi:MAG: hypothetical protein GF416_02945 [Candidatus Altiarchaeales archaeon]|nr:hypothetical protein [Candidatus Altiarchaeales archaeon]MBD3416077.1 hypothetical protein [Candidatus Altiarchaeales archaeon]
MASDRYSIEFDLTDGEEILVLRLIGDYDMTADEDAIKKVAEEIKEHGTQKLLCDYRECNLKTSITAQYDRPKTISEMGIPKTTRIAGVHPEITEDIKFMEDVYNNQGYAMKAFTDYREALDWLKEGRLTEEV